MTAIKGFLTVSETAERLGLSVDRIYQFIVAGRLEATRVGGKMLLVSEIAVRRFQRKPPGRPRKSAAPSTAAERSKKGAQK